MASIINAATSGGLVTTADTSGILQLQTAGTTAVTVDASQNVTFANSASLPNTFGFKNRIINGAMVIDQRNAGAAVTADNSFAVDRFKINNTTDGTFSAQQSTTAPTGFVNSLSVTITAADASLAATQRLRIQYAIEGNSVSDFDLGTASASTFTLSFYVRSSLTGTFGGSVQNNDADRSYVFTYTINAANTWEQKTITIVGDTSGTWATTTSIGLRLNFGLGIGSSYSGTAGSWTASNNMTATGAVSVVGTNGATWYVTGVQLEKGSTATSFDMRPYGTELMLCQRYYQQNTVPTAGFYGNTIGQVYAGTNVQSGFQLATPMRSTPSASIIGTLTWNGGSAGNTTVNLSSFGTIYYTAPSMLISFIGTVASSQTGGYNWAMSSSAGGGYSLSAEL